MTFDIITSNKEDDRETNVIDTSRKYGTTAI